MLPETVHLFFASALLLPCSSQAVVHVRKFVGVTVGTQSWAGQVNKR